MDCETAPAYSEALLRNHFVVLVLKYPGLACRGRRRACTSWSARQVICGVWCEAPFSCIVALIRRGYWMTDATHSRCALPHTRRYSFSHLKKKNICTPYYSAPLLPRVSHRSNWPSLHWITCARLALKRKIPCWRVCQPRSSAKLSIKPCRWYAHPNPNGRP